MNLSEGRHQKDRREERDRGRGAGGGRRYERMKSCVLEIVRNFFVKTMMDNNGWT